MPRKQDFTKHAINLRAGDYLLLQSFGEIHGIQASYIIRRLVSKFVDDLEDPNEARFDNVQITTKELTDDI